jgi:lysophospholipase L1-like esterase
LFDVECAKGRQFEERWSFTPTADDAGEHPLSLEVRDLDDRTIARGEAVVRVCKPDANADRPIALLAIGDSLTHGAIYTDELMKLFAEPGHPKFKLLGTHKIPKAADGNVHEGIGGWRFETFVTKYEAQPQENRMKGGSPFVFLVDGKPTFDFPRYVRESLKGETPTHVTVMLGTNDVFRCTDENLEQTIDAILIHAETLLTGIRAGAPQARIGVALTVPPSASQDAFAASYGSSQTRWQYRKNQHRFVERVMEKYGERATSDNLALIPTHINLDCVNNYPRASEAPANARSKANVSRQNNAVHPADAGYRQIGDTFYCWLRGQ